MGCMRALASRHLEDIYMLTAGGRQSPQMWAVLLQDVSSLNGETHSLLWACFGCDGVLLQDCGRNEKRRGKKKSFLCSYSCQGVIRTITLIVVCYCFVVDLVPPRFPLLLPVTTLLSFPASSLLLSLLCSHSWQAEDREYGIPQSLPGDGRG